MQYNWSYELRILRQKKYKNILAQTRAEKTPMVVAVMKEWCWLGFSPEVTQVSNYWFYLQTWGVLSTIFEAPRITDRATATH